MTAPHWIGVVAIAAALFLVVDLIWLGTVANAVYTRLLGDLKRDSPNWPAALLFYALFVLGLVWFAVRPAIDGGSVDLGTAALNGALYGLFTYATWDLTNAAVIRGFPFVLAPLDMAWGTILSCIVATGSALAARTWFV